MSSIARKSSPHAAKPPRGAGTASPKDSPHRRCTRRTCTSTGRAIRSWRQGSPLLFMPTRRPSRRRPMPDYDLHHHGDREVGEGLVDLAVNVRLPVPPEWLRQELAAALVDLAAYPDVTTATHAVAHRHGRAVDDVLVAAGAAEAFTLLATAL